MEGRLTLQSGRRDTRLRRSGQEVSVSKSKSISQSYNQSIRPGMHVSPKWGIGKIPKHKTRTSVQKRQNDMRRTERSVWTCCCTALIRSADYTADQQHSVQTQRHGSAKLSYLVSPLNQINNTDNLDSGQDLLTFNRVWLMFGQSKLAEKETWSAFYPLTKSLFS